MNDYLNAYCQTLMRWPRDGLGVLIGVGVTARLGITGTKADAVADAANFAVVTITAPSARPVYELSPITGLNRTAPSKRKVYEPPVRGRSAVLAAVPRVPWPPIIAKKLDISALVVT